MAGRTVAFRFYVDWDFNGTFTDESAYVASARGDMRLAPPEQAISGNSGIVSSMSVTLRNAAGRFSPLRTDGALYAYLANGGGYHAPCYMEVSVDGGSNYYRVFTGVLKLPSESTLTSKENPTVTIEARSLEELYLQKRYSSAAANTAIWHESGFTEADYINGWLQYAAGVDAGDLVIDPGLFVVPWAWLDDESPIEDAWQMAAACGGRVYADPDGDFVFENMAHWQVSSRSTSSQFTFTKDDYINLSLRYDDTELYNVVTVEAAPRSPASLDVLWESETVPLIEPGATKLITARFNTPCYSTSGVQFEAHDQGGTSRTADVSISATYYAQRADLTVTNASTHRVYLYPLRVLGTPIVGGPEIEESRNSTDDGANAAFFTTRGTTRTRAVRGNPYIQTAAHAGTLAQFLLDRHEKPRVTIKLAGVQGQPALRLSDRVTITDASTMTSSQQCYVLGVAWTLGGGFKQDIDAVQASNVFPYDGLYFVVGTHTVGASRRVFY